MKTLLLATRNPNKIREILEILGDSGFHLRSLLDYPELPDTVEDGATLEENALKKARSALRLTGLPSLADDSGLEVFHLNGKPGVHSARYAGETATYADNNRKLLRELQNASSEERRAVFRSVIAFVAPGVEQIVEGRSPGTIAKEPRGKGGFGYDPLFIPEGFDKTYAELEQHLKNRISHRGIALQRIIGVLRIYFAGSP